MIMFVTFSITEDNTSRLLLLLGFLFLVSWKISPTDFYFPINFYFVRLQNETTFSSSSCQGDWRACFSLPTCCIWGSHGGKAVKHQLVVLFFLETTGVHILLSLHHCGQVVPRWKCRCQFSTMDSSSLLLSHTHVLLMLSLREIWASSWKKLSHVSILVENTSVYFITLIVKAIKHCSELSNIM